MYHLSCLRKVWKEVRNTTMAIELINTLETIKEMILDEYMSKAEEEKQEVSQKIQVPINILYLINNDKYSASQPIHLVSTSNIKHFKAQVTE